MKMLSVIRSKLFVKYVILGLMAVFLVSCSGTAQQATPTVIVRHATQIQPTATITPWPRPKPTWTPGPTATPTNIITLLSAYHLPTWMGNPATNIMASLITDDTHEPPKISFYNAATGGKYDIRVPDDVIGYFWYDNAHFGFLSTDLKTIQLINMKTGKTTKDPVSPEALRLWNQEYKDYSISGMNLQALEVVPDNVPSGEILLEQIGWNWNKKSKSKLFKADWGIYNDDIVITDTRNEQAVWEIKFPKDTYGTVSAAWSPTNENQLAFVRGKHIPFNDLDMEEIELTIVDVVSKKILWTYSGNYGDIVWSPNGKMILYRNAASLFSSYGVGFQNPPCIIFVETGLKRCLRNIPRLVPPGFVLGTTAQYAWDANNESISYIYLYYPLSNKENEMTGNVCIYSLKDGHIHCPTQNLPALKGNSITGYEISPDHQYINFCYSDATILNDYAGNSQDAIIDMDGKGFFSWVGTFQNDGPHMCSETLWRPLP